jgi:hypothetical protein
MVLHMLRFVLGDSIFYAGLRSYLNDEKLAYAFATTADLRLHLETASGKNLGTFFNQWIYGKGFPSYTVNWQQDFSNHVTLKIHQTQSDASVSFFEMPVPLRFSGASRDTTLVLQNNCNDQQFEFDLPFAADTLLFDPDLWLVSKDNAVVRLPASEFSFSIYPNPAHDVLQIRVETSETRDATILITNEIGQVVWRDNQQFLFGSSTVSIDTEQLANGIYFMKIAYGKSEIIQRFVLIK